MSITSYLGIDVGSVTTKLAVVDEKGQYVHNAYSALNIKEVEAWRVQGGDPYQINENDILYTFDSSINEYKYLGKARDFYWEAY